MLQQGASSSEIRRAYRKLSLIYHPDKETGDEKRFMRIAKAYAAWVFLITVFRFHDSFEDSELIRMGTALCVCCVML